MNILKKNKHYNISEILLAIILITLPLGGYAINSSAVILFFLISLYIFIISKQKMEFNKISFLLIAFYSLCLLSLIWTDNVENTKTGLIRFLSFLVLPLAFFFNSTKNFNTKKIIDLFSKALVFFAAYCMLFGAVNSVTNADISFLFYHKLSGVLGDLNAIYLSVFVSLGVSFFLYKKEKSKMDIFCLTFLSFFLLLLSSKMIITITFITFIFYFFKKRKIKKINLKYVFIMLSISIVFLFASSNISKRFKVEFEKTKINQVLNKKEFGPVYLWTGLGLRVFQTKAFVEVLQEQKKVFLGFGLNNSQNALNNKYKEYKLYPGFLNYNYHNQYIQVFAELGVIGLSLLLLISFLILKNAIKHKDYFLLSFIILILVVCITESFLWRQRGMIFFITIILLCTQKKKKYSI